MSSPGICKICGKPTRSKSSATCSPYCQGELLSQNLTGRNLSSGNTGQCAICKTPINHRTKTCEDIACKRQYELQKMDPTKLLPDLESRKMPDTIDQLELPGHGTIDWVDGNWVVECTPYVMIYLKRVFEKIPKGAHGKIILSGSLENARQLQWFRQRFPMPAPPKLEEMARAHEEHERTITNIIEKGTCPDYALAREPREYQKVAAHLCQTTGGLLLGDDVGLGKSMSAICAVHKTLPALIVTLTHLPNQWKREILATIPDAKVWIVPTAAPPTPNFMQTFSGKPDFVICSYSKLTGWAGTLAEYVRSVAYDEVQELRHAGTNRYLAAQRITAKTELRMGMSATPIYNYGDEIFNVLDLIKPGCLGHAAEFFREWCSGMNKKASIRENRAFGYFLRAQGLMLRRTRAEVKREIPPVQNIEYEIEHDEAVLNKWMKGCTELAKILLYSKEKNAAFRAGGEFDHRMRQATGLAKAPYVVEFVKMLLEAEKRVIVYAWHRAVYTEYAKGWTDYNPVFYTGTETPREKDKAVDAFIKGNSRILVLSLRAGAGLDGLQHVCRTVVYGELDWSPGIHVQCTGRLGRDGQQDPVTAYYLTSNEGADPVMLDVLDIKKQIAQFVDPDAPLTETKDPDHIKKLAERILGVKEDVFAEFGL